MKTILLVGLGRFGKHIAQELSESNAEVMAIDKDEERVNKILPYVTDAQIGDSTNVDFLESLGVGNFDVCVVSIGDSFQDSLETVSLLKDLGAKKVIARASTGVHEKFLRRNGADEVVYPEKQLAAWTAVSCTSDTVLDYIKLDDDYSIFELVVPDEWDGRTLIDLDIRKKYGVNVLGLRKEGELTMSISPSTVFEAGDSVLVLGNKKTIQKTFKI